jgi:hypothetical protein
MKIFDEIKQAPIQTKVLIIIVIVAIAFYTIIIEQ